MKPHEFREARRDYGVMVPVAAGEVEAHIANGWTLIDDAEHAGRPLGGKWPAEDQVLMRPPAQAERAA